MTRQDVPKLTGTPRRPRRAEPPAPTASRFPYRSPFVFESRVLSPACATAIPRSASVQHALS